MVYGKLSRNELRDLLSENVLRVTFNKKNGDRRVMTCTLKQDLLPKSTNTTSYKEALTSLSVWDTNANGWRAFCLDKIQNVEKV
jgi:hypothetical protein